MRSHTMDHKQGLAKNAAGMGWALMVMGCLVVAQPAHAQTTLYTLNSSDFLGATVVGRRVEAIGDINGDGHSDFIVNASFSVAGTGAWVVSGIDGSFIYNFTQRDDSITGTGIGAAGQNPTWDPTVGPDFRLGSINGCVPLLENTVTLPGVGLSGGNPAPPSGGPGAIGRIIQWILQLF